MNINELNNLNNFFSNLSKNKKDNNIDIKLTKKFIKEKIKNNENLLIFLDLNSLTIIPYIKNESYLYKNVPITPAYNTIKYLNTLELIFKDFYKNVYLFGVIDNGISRKFKYLEYKNNRKHSIERNSFSLNENDIYSSNIKIIQEYMKNKKNMYLDISPGESDFKIGYILKFLYQDVEKNDNVNEEYKLFYSSDVLTISRDRDYIQTILYSDFLLMRKMDQYIFFKKNDINFLNEYIKKFFNFNIEISNVIEYIIFKALVGDKIDNIKNILNKKDVINIFKLIRESKNENLNDILFKIKNYIDDKFKLNSEEKFKEFLKNIYLTNIYNDDLDFNIKEILRNSIKDSIQIFKYENQENIKKIENLFF